MPDDAWYVEFSEARPAPPEWAEIPDAVRYLPGDTFATAVVPDEDPEREPLVCARGEWSVPYEVMAWFMGKVTEEVQRCRAAMDGGDAHDGGREQK